MTAPAAPPQATGAPERTPTVGVALVNWNSGTLTLDCVRSLLGGTVRPDLIVVVDNASQDGSPEQLEAQFGHNIVLIRNAGNEGFAGANNQAIAYLLQHNADYLWILNNDTIVAADCLARLLSVAQRHADAGAVSAKIYYDTPPDRIWYAGAYRHAWHGAPKHELTGAMDAAAVGDAVSVEFVSGCCMLASACVFRTYGGFARSYVAYSEDSDWCWRVRDAGLRLYYAPQAVMWHKLSASVKKNTGGQAQDQITPFAGRLMVRNHLWTVRKRQKPAMRRWLCLGVNIGIQVRNICLFAARSNFPLAKATWDGLRQGLAEPAADDAPMWPCH